MIISQLFIAVVVAAAYIRLASSFQPGSDYGAYKTLNLYNCTGHARVSNVTEVNAADTLPQIEPCSGRGGWEQWSLFLHGTFPVLLRWRQGVPGSSAPPSSPAEFDILIADVDGTTVQRKVTGRLAYTDGEHVKQIKIGESSLTWDAGAMWYNVSVSVDGYRLALDSFSATFDAFHPNVAFHDGSLDPSGGWFGSVPLIRGQVVGNIHTPSNQTIAIYGLSFMHHMFSDRPLPSYIDQYAAGVVWGHSTSFYDSHVFYKTQTTNGSIHEAAFLGRALPTPSHQGKYTSAWATYAITDDRALYHLSISPSKHLNASFSGCADSGDVPYVFNVTASTLLGELMDLGGGKTAYYGVTGGETRAGFEGGVVTGAIAGVIEAYSYQAAEGDGDRYE